MSDKKEIPAYTEESETEDSLAAKRSYFHDKDISVPLAKAWEAGCAYGWSTAKLPWKKPSETPVSGHDCILKVPGIGGNMLTYLARTWMDSPVTFYSDDGERIPMEAVHCWMYAHELPFPLPEWVTK